MTAVSRHEYTLLLRFNELRKTLLDRARPEQLSQPLGYWAATQDRMLPYSLLARPVDELVRSPFGDLAQTPGIGPKKMASLIMLLERVVADAACPHPRSAGTAEHASADAFDSASVSAAQWRRWTATVRRHNLRDVQLGRLAPSLQDLPTVLWKKPLEDYAELDLTQLRSLKTHGDKRVRAVLQIFQVIDCVLGQAGRHRGLCLLLKPQFTEPIEHWIAEQLASRRNAAGHEIRTQLALPLLNQIATDGGETVHRLACGRIGIEAEVESVRCQANALGLTKSRVYQQLDTCARIMEVRWPEGAGWLGALEPKISRHPAQREARLLFEQMQALLFPQRIAGEADAIPHSSQARRWSLAAVD